MDSKERMVISEMGNSSLSEEFMIVKIPKYLTERFARSQPGEVVGSIFVNPMDKSVHLKLKSKSDSCVNLEKNQESSIPLEYNLGFPKHIEKVDTLVVSRCGMAEGEGVGEFAGHDSYNDQFKLLGMVSSRTECQPLQSSNYYEMKKNTITALRQPTKNVQLIETVANNNYRPVSNRVENAKIEAKKKEDGKRVRVDENKVREILFAAFENHQFYALKDLVDMTKQPVMYLKSILNEIAVYNTKPPNKYLWELKPEFRHYNINNSNNLEGEDN